MNRYANQPHIMNDWFQNNRPSSKYQKLQNLANYAQQATIAAEQKAQAKKQSEINELKNYLSQNGVGTSDKGNQTTDEYLEYLRKLKQVCDEQKVKAEAKGNRSLDFSPLSNALNNLWRPLSVVLDIVMGFIPFLGGIYGIFTGLMGIFSGNGGDMLFGFANVLFGAISLAGDITTAGASTVVGVAKQFNKIAKLGGVDKFIKTTKEAINASSSVGRALNNMKFENVWLLGGLITTGTKALLDLFFYLRDSLTNIINQF